MIKYYDDFVIIIRENIILLYENEVSKNKGIELIKKHDNIKNIIEISKTEAEIITEKNEIFVWLSLIPTKKYEDLNSKGASGVISFIANKYKIKNYINLNLTFDVLDGPFDFDKNSGKYLNNTELDYGKLITISFTYEEAQFGFLLFNEIVMKIEDYHEIGLELMRYEIWGDLDMLEKGDMSRLKTELFVRIASYRNTKYKILIKSSENLENSKYLIIHTDTTETLQGEELEGIINQIKS